ncbi:MAG: hypothetical protein EOO24_43295 [Comamonadaceae bacterium]|nr:MAG: hypothetical protein EOO24_43295 [Comamonadaceae bacterium]
MGIAKTEAGQQVLKDRSVPLTACQRAALIMLDGRRTVAQVLAATAAAGVTQDDIDRLLALGLVAQAPSRPAPLAGRSRHERYVNAHAIATRLTAALGVQGLRLNLAVEAAGSLEDLQALAPLIRQAVGAERFAALDAALQDR